MKSLALFIFLLCVWVSPTYAGEPAWQTYLQSHIKHPYEAKPDGALLVLKIANVNPLSPRDFDYYLLQTVAPFLNSSHPFTVVMVEAGGEQHKIFRARLTLDDVAAFNKKVISEPELLRRFAVSVVETVVSLKIRLQEERKQGLLSAAQKTLEAWIELEPNSVLALTFLGHVLRDQKKYWEAIAYYKKNLEQDSLSLGALYDLAFCYEKAGAYADAINMYEQALHLQPDNEYFMKQLARVYQKNRNYQAALDWAQKSRALKDDPELSMIEGNAHRDAKKFTKAMEAYAMGYKQSPRDHRFLFNQILVDLDVKQYAQAKKKYDELLKKDPVLGEELSQVFIKNEVEEK